MMAKKPKIHRAIEMNNLDEVGMLVTQESVSVLSELDQWGRTGIVS